jgi:STE24 endopeptidase
MKISLIILLLFMPSISAKANVSTAPSLVASRSANKAPEKIVTAYSLPPELSKKATALGTFRFRFAVFGIFYQLLLLGVVLHFKVAAKFRDWAEKASPKRGVQAIVFTSPLILTLSILGIPEDIYEEWVSRAYGLSIQGWGSWFGDWVKSQLIGVVLGVIVVSILFWVIRLNSRKWWLYFWFASLPILAATTFLQPLVIDPLFHKFEPLARKAPELTLRLEEMVHQAGQDIPPERMYWMGAGEKTTTLNAYVTGMGASKRIVVWDTTLAKMDTSQIVFVAGHEMGHYVLGHIWKSLLLTAVLFFFLFYLGFRLIAVLLKKKGTQWGIRGVDDWAALPALILLFSIFMTLSMPIMNAVSRHIEHQADQYGLKVTHDLGPDAAQKAAQAFQILGEVGLSEVDPHPLNVWLFYSHPTLADRIRFALADHP